MHRRSFIALSGATGAPLIPRATRTRVPRVEASSSVFFGHPAAERTLVRFRGYDVEAPAGRMRITGGRGDLLGTAGLLRRGDHLYGESWLLTRDVERFTTHLEAPGLDRPVRDTHRLNPTTRWNIHWITVADPFEIDRFLSSLTPEHLAVAKAIMLQSGVMTNPLAVDVSWASADHLNAFRSSIGARDVETRWGIGTSPVAIADRRLFDLSAAPLLLSGNGVAFAFTPGSGTGAPFEIVQGRDGSRITVAETAGGSEAAALGFGAARDVMVTTVERWLEASPSVVSPEYLPDTAMVISTGVEPDRGTMLTRVEEWNGRFAYPRIVIGGIDELIGRTEWVQPRRSVPVVQSPRPPTAAQLRTATAERRKAVTDRMNQIIEPMAQLYGASPGGADGFLRQARFPFDGHVVFNPSPYSRSDYVTFPDGSERLATNVPALGYAYTPELNTSAPPPSSLEPGVYRLSGQTFDLYVSEQTGAIVSLIERERGIDWVAGSPDGLNHVEGADVEEVVRTRLPSGATRLAFSRRSPVGRITTRITAYDDNRWIDVVNETESERIPVDYRFTPGGTSTDIWWETPGGYEQAPAPLGTHAHLRWLAVAGEHGKLLLRCIDSPYFRAERIGDSTRVVSLTTGGTNRFRLDAVPPFWTVSGLTRFGWDAEPLLAHRATTDGVIDAESFGRVVRCDATTVVAGMKMADDGFALVLYLQNPSPVPFPSTVEPGLLRFATARRVDFVERDLGEELPVVDGRTEVEVPAYGVRAIRLSGLNLNT